MSAVRIINADVIDGLRQLDDESVQTVITSPPYWGLRDYGIPPSIWGGDPDCLHGWDAEIVDRTRATPGINGSGLTNDGAHQAATARFEMRSRFCTRCGAWEGHLGLEPSYQLYVEHMVLVFREIRRVLRKDGTVWLNLGDTYNAGRNGGHVGGGKQGADARYNGLDRSGVNASNRGHRQVGDSKNPNANVPVWGPNRTSGTDLKPKDLVGIPWRVAFALQADGWYLRQDIIWAKPNPMPESTRDRCTKSHEYLFLLSKRERYFYDATAIAEDVTKTGTPGHLQCGTNSRENVRRTPNWKTPDGWDTSTGKGGHGAFHKEGREAGQTGYVKKSKNKARKHAADRGVPVPRPENERDRKGCPNTAGAVAGSVPWEGVTRNKRDVWSIATTPYPEAHFATFPPELVEPCILAGSSEKGCCSECGTPIKRQVTSETVFMGGSGAAGRSAEDANANGKWAGERYGDNLALGPGTITKTVGWAPQCKCNASTVPCVVLDPFGGAGTVGLVARNLNRRAVLIEIGPQYCTMADTRVHGALFAGHVETP